MSDAAVFTLRVDIEPGSLSLLAAAGAALYVFPAFASSNRTAVPLVAEIVHPLASANVIRWDDTCRTFASHDDLSAGVADPPRRTIFPGNEERVRIGDAVSVGPSLHLAATPDGVAGAVTFRTTGPGRFTCGLVFGPGTRLGCAATLTAGLDVSLAPIRSIFLMVSTSTFEARAWVERSTSPGLVVDTTGAAARTVTFDTTVPESWREADQPWAQAVPAGASLNDLLRRITPANAPW